MKVMRKEAPQIQHRPELPPAFFERVVVGDSCDGETKATVNRIKVEWHSFRVEVDDISDSFDVAMWAYRLSSFLAESSLERQWTLFWGPDISYDKETRELKIRIYGVRASPDEVSVP